MKTNKYWVMMVLLFMTITAFGQSKLTPKQIWKEHYQQVVPIMKHDQPEPDQFPSYPGGIQGLYKDIMNKLDYPRNAIKEGISGRVVVRFVVEKDGTVDKVQVVKSVDKLLDQEAVWLVKHLRPWVPGYKNDKPVSVDYNLPVSFTLPSKKMF